MPSYFKEFSNIFRYGLPAASRVPDYADWEMFENLNLNIFAKSKPLLEIIAEKSRDTVILKLRMCLGSLPAIYGKPGLHAVVLAGVHLTNHLLHQAGKVPAPVNTVYQAMSAAVICKSIYISDLSITCTILTIQYRYLYNNIFGLE